MKRFILSLLVVLALSMPIRLSAQASLADKKLIATVSQSVVMVHAALPEGATGVCTGFVVNSTLKHVLSARHCAIDNRIGPLYVDGKPAKIIKEDLWFILLQAPELDKPALAIETRPVTIGDDAIAFGFGDGRTTVMFRRIIQFVRALDENKYSHNDIALDGGLIPGMSGGPIVNSAGRVIALNQMSNPLYGVGFGCGQAEIRAFLLK